MQVDHQHYRFRYQEDEENYQTDDDDEYAEHADNNKSVSSEHQELPITTDDVVLVHEYSSGGREKGEKYNESEVAVMFVQETGSQV